LRGPASDRRMRESSTSSSEVTLTGFVTEGLLGEGRGMY
jgi:hypothetical protein